MNCQLKDLGEIITGNTPSKKENSYYETKDIPFIKPDVLADNELIIKTPSDYLSEKARNKARIVNKGSILVTCIGSIGKIGVCQGECAFNQQINTIVPNDKVRSDYLAYNLIYNKQRLIDIANCSVVPIINKKQFSEFSIKVDLNKETQQKIVAKLDNLNLAIDKCKRLLELHDELIKSKFYEMFGDIHNSDLYKYVPVDSFTKVTSGGTPSRNKTEFWNNGLIPWVKTNELKNTKINITEEYITELGLLNSSAKLMPKDTILIALYGQGKTRGMTGLLNIEAATNQACACILPSNDMNTVYLWKYFQFSYNKLRNMSKGSTQPNLTGEIIKKFLVLNPPLSLQTQFAQYVETVESSKTKIKELQSRIEYLKASYMQEFFA